MEQKQYQKFKKNWKTEFRDLVNLKLLLNHNELEKIIDMKKMRLDDIFPMVYHLLRTDKRFRRNHEKTLAATHRAPSVFETALKPRGISKNVQHGEVAHNP